MSTKQTTQFRVTINSEYVSIYRARGTKGRDRSPLAFYYVPKEAKSAAEAVATVLRWYFGKGAGSFRLSGDSTRISCEAYDRLGLTREKAGYGEVSVIVPEYVATIDLEKAEGQYRAYFPRAA